MPPPDGNFQDYVGLTQDSLYHKGAQLAVGTSTASTVQILFSNSAGALALAATATGNATVWLPSAGGTLLPYINVSAGPASANLSALTFSNINGVSFGLNGSVITGSVVTNGITAVNLSAGTTSQNLTAFTLSNSNGISFGLNASTITASAAILNLSAGTTSNNVNAVTFSNSNGVSFGLNGSTLTASAAILNLSAGSTSQNLNAVTFSNSNGVSFGLNGSTLTGSVATSLTNINVSAGATSNYLSAITFSNSNGITFGLNGSTLTASYSGLLNLSAGTTSNNLNAVTFSNSNAITFGLNSSTLTASYNFNLSAGSTSQNLNAVTFSNSNAISFGLNGSTLTAELQGLSSWSNGAIITSFALPPPVVAFISLQPLLIDYNITVTNIVQLASIAGSTTNVSGGFTLSMMVYTINGGTGGSLSSASSASSNFTWTSGAQYSSTTGVNYLQMSVASWAFTPGPYVLGVWVKTANSASLAFYGNYAQNSIVSGMGSLLTNMVFPGYLNASTAAWPGSISIKNTTQWIRSGTSAFNQPWVLFQGT